MTRIHADIEALKGFREALAGFRAGQRDLADLASDRIELTHVSLQAKASSARARLEQCQAEFEACQARAAQAAADDRPPDCSGYAGAVARAGQRLDRIRGWQQRVDQEASEFRVAAGRFLDLMDADLPRAEAQLAALIASLEGARRVQAPGR